MCSAPGRARGAGAEKQDAKDAKEKRKDAKECRENGDRRCRVAPRRACVRRVRALDSRVRGNDEGVDCRTPAAALLCVLSFHPSAFLCVLRVDVECGHDRASPRHRTATIAHRNDCSRRSLARFAVRGFATRLRRTVATLRRNSSSVRNREKSLDVHAGSHAGVRYRTRGTCTKSRMHACVPQRRDAVRSSRRIRVSFRRSHATFGTVTASIQRRS